MSRLSRVPSGARLCAAALSLALGTGACGSPAAPSEPITASSARSTSTAILSSPAATPAAGRVPVLQVPPCPESAESTSPSPLTSASQTDAPDSAIPEASALQKMEEFRTDFPQSLAVASGSLWTANEFIDTVTRIDADSGHVTPISAPGIRPQRVVAAGDAVWSGGSGGLVRIDPGSNAVEQHVAGCVLSIVAAFGSVWGAEVGGVVRIDPETGLTVSEIRTEGQESCGVSAADDSVWLGCGQDLYRIDPTTNEVSATVREVGIGPTVIAADGVAWVLTELDPFHSATADDAFATIERLDLATNRLVPGTTTRLVRGASVGRGLADGHIVWLPTSWGNGPGAGKLYAFEPASGTVRAAFDISEGKGYGANALAFAYGSLWLASGQPNVVRRFERPTP